MCVRLPDWCLLFTQALMWVIAGTACNLKWRRNDLVPLGAAATPLSAPQPGAPWAPYMETSGREGGGPCRLGRLGCKRNRRWKFLARTNKKEAFYFTVLARLPSCRQSRWLLIGQRIWSCAGQWLIKSPRWSPQTDREFLALEWNYRRQFKMQCGESNFASSKYWRVPWENKVANTPATHPWLLYLHSCLHQAVCNMTPNKNFIWGIEFFF